MSADDCTPLKSLRTTIKVFIRTQEKKRDEARSKSAKDSAPPTPIDAKPNAQITGSDETPAADTPSQSAAIPDEREESAVSQPAPVADANTTDVADADVAAAQDQNVGVPKTTMSV